MRAPELTAEAIKTAMIHGNFYASTGVELEDYQANAKHIAVKINSGRSGARYRTQFTGKNGRVLQESAGATATYSIQGDELYVRARITDSNGHQAWTQPVFVQVPELH